MADLPPNIKVLGHVEGILKHQLVSSAWVLVNTSIHEALPTSFLEALARETPLSQLAQPGGRRFAVRDAFYRGAAETA